MASIGQKSYNHMLTTGSEWAKVRTRHHCKGLLLMQEMSARNIKIIRHELQVLREDEKQFLEIFLKLKLRATHASDASLINENGTLCLFSRKKLQHKNIVFDTEHTSAKDRLLLGNDDFVFSPLNPARQNKRVKAALVNVSIILISIDQILPRFPG